MAPKRAASDSEDETDKPQKGKGRERKKQKVHFARTIPVQEGNPPDSMAGLPAAIDIERFVEARSFEIDAMQKAMKNAPQASTQRAWQALPRHMRRRAASHDVRRVPLRLRERAVAELDPAKQKAKRSQPKRGREARISRTQSFLKRQRDKTWLETHIWHAKRMKMENMWGYRLAVHPTEKSFRPSHRASIHGSILHDASYFSLIELKGPEQTLVRILEMCCDLQGPGPGSDRYLTGSRILNTHMYKPGSYPFDLISPITVMWNPSTHVEPPNGKGKGKDQNDMPRAVWIRSHPAVFDDVFSSLQTASSTTLESIRLSAPNEEPVEVELADLREQVNVFEIMGPKANQMLKGALTPVAEDKRDEFRKFWTSLNNLQTSGSLPRDMVIGLKVYDPRLKFPPKNAKQKSDALPSSVSPTNKLAESEIWDESKRDSLRRPRYKTKDLNERRSKNLIPGTALAPLRQDDRVPGLLIQRTLEGQSSSKSQAIHGWTLIVPSGWSMPFFSSLTYTGTRVGGQRERQTQAFEAGTAYFPRDYPGTAEYDAFAGARAGEEQRRWERTPPAKRASWEKLGTRSPWRPDWDVVLGLCEAGVASAQRGDENATRIWHLCGPDVKSVVENVAKSDEPGSVLLVEINQLRAKRQLGAIDVAIGNDMLLGGSLITARLTMCGRGAPEDMAVIYFVDDDEAKRWNTLFSSKRPITESEAPEELELSDIKPSQTATIGYVTAGNYSLSRGQGFAIGVIPLKRLLDLKRQATRLGVSSLLVKVRDRNGFKCRAAHLEVISR